MWDICQAIKQPVESQAVLFYSCTFAIGERYQRQPPINIHLGLKHLRLAAWFRNVEIAAGASQSVRTLLKERVTAVAMTDIVVLPRFTCSRRAAQHSLSVDQHFDGTNISAK